MCKHAKKLRKRKVENCSFHIHFQFSKMVSSITSLNKIIAQLVPLDFRLCDVILGSISLYLQFHWTLIIATPSQVLSQFIFSSFGLLSLRCPPRSARCYLAPKLLINVNSQFKYNLYPFSFNIGKKTFYYSNEAYDIQYLRPHWDSFLLQLQRDAEPVILRWQSWNHESFIKNKIAYNISLKEWLYKK